MAHPHGPQHGLPPAQFFWFKFISVAWNRQTPKREDPGVQLVLQDHWDLHDFLFPSSFPRASPIHHLPGNGAGQLIECTSSGAVFCPVGKVEGLLHY